MWRTAISLAFSLLFIALFISQGFSGCPEECTTYCSATATGTSGYFYPSYATNYLYYKTTAAGGFTVNVNAYETTVDMSCYHNTVSATSYNYTLPTITSSGVFDSSSPYSRAYTWTTGSTASGNFIVSGWLYDGCVGSKISTTCSVT